MTDEAATGLDQTASVAPAAETNPTPAQESPKNHFEQFVSYLEKELNEIKEALELRLRKNDDGSKNIAIQVIGKAGELIEFPIHKTEA